MKICTSVELKAIPGLMCVVYVLIVNLTSADCMVIVNLMSIDHMIMINLTPVDHMVIVNLN